MGGDGAGWDERHAYFEEIARPVTERMIELLDPSPGDALLELAAGTGVVGFSAAALVGPTGRVVVSDFAGAMVDVASRRAEQLDSAMSIVASSMPSASSFRIGPSTAS